ncbi:hypothetical protein ACEQ8H_001468 [Pleosporales sp. CAS-2024a]
MGRTAPPAYRDDPDTVSLHTTPDDYSYHDALEISDPPSYADSESATLSALGTPLRHVPPPTTRTNHNSPSFKKGKPVVCEVDTLMDPKLDSDPAALEQRVRHAGNDMPVPYIYLMGTHKETVQRGDKKETHHVTDFRIVINMQRYINNGYGTRYCPPAVPLTTVENSEKTHRGTIRKCRDPRAKQDIEIGTPKPTLQEWCHRYCASPRLLRVFRLERAVTGFDEAYVARRVQGLVASAQYRGHVSITFPVEDGYLDVYTANRINQWRLNPWVQSLFYFSFLWILAWPCLFFLTHRYAVVRAHWPFSRTNPDGSKTYTTVSEEMWFDTWKLALRRLVLERYQGEATEDIMISVMARPEDPPMPGTLCSGHEGLDNAVGLLAQGVRVAGAISNGGTGLQGGWGYDT